MSTLPGDKPDRQRNFHDSKGRHIFPHPREYQSRKGDWTAWDKRYAEHLDRHQELLKNPEPMDGDPAAVHALFEHIACLESIIEKEKKMIVALRQKAVLGAPEDDLDRDVERAIGRGRRP